LVPLQAILLEEINNGLSQFRRPFLHDPFQTPTQVFIISLSLETLHLFPTRASEVLLLRLCHFHELIPVGPNSTSSAVMSNALHGGRNKTPSISSICDSNS
jgi:hypothetical protein